MTSKPPNPPVGKPASGESAAVVELRLIRKELQETHEELSQLRTYVVKQIDNPIGVSVFWNVFKASLAMIGIYVVLHDVLSIMAQRS